MICCFHVGPMCYF